MMRPPAPPVLVKCRAIVPQTPDACGKTAEMIVTFSDGDVLYACRECALQLQQTALSHGTRIGVARIQ